MISLTRQNGMTSMGMVLTVISIGFILLMAMRIIPMYLDHYSIAGSISSMATDPELVGMSAPDIRRRLQRRFEVNSIRSVSSRDAKIKRVNGGNEIRLNYEARATLFGNLDVIARFDTTALVPDR